MFPRRRRPKMFPRHRRAIMLPRRSRSRDGETFSQIGPTWKPFRGGFQNIYVSNARRQADGETFPYFRAGFQKGFHVEPEADGATFSGRFPRRRGRSDGAYAFDGATFS